MREESGEFRATASPWSSASLDLDKHGNCEQLDCLLLSAGLQGPGVVINKPIGGARVAGGGRS